MTYRGYEIINDRDHVVIKKDGKMISTADTAHEAYHDIDEISNT